MKTIMLSILVLSLASANLNAEIIYIPKNERSIQAGIEKAVEGDTVLVDEGVYYENINFRGKAITVASKFLLDKDYSFIRNTVIQGDKVSESGSGAVVTFNSGEDTTSVIYGFTISGGKGAIVGNGQFKSGGGIACLGSGAKILYNRIEKNSIRANLPSYGAGIGHGPSYDDSYLIIEHNWLEHNTIVGKEFSSGAAIHVYGNGRICNNLIRYNLCNSSEKSTTGGGISAWGGDSGGKMLICNNTITYNRALSLSKHSQGGAGGGLWFGGYTGSQVKGNRIQYNEVSGTMQSFGAGVSLQELDGSNKFCGNFVLLNFTSGTGTGKGGGVSIWKSSVSLFNNVVSFNRSKYGGGIYLYDVFNKQQESVYPTFINNTVVSNFAKFVGGGVFVLESEAIFLNGIVWDNTALRHPGISKTGSLFDVRYSDIQDGQDTNGNISADPQFSGSSYELSDKSPCIGAGVDEITIRGVFFRCPDQCLVGHARPLPPETMPDMGAIESLFGPVSSINYSTESLPNEFALKQNYPNPFNPTTTIAFSVPTATHVKLSIFNALGQEVGTLISEDLVPGNYTTTWDAFGFASGIYYYRLETDQRIISTKKLILLK